MQCNIDCRSSDTADSPRQVTSAFGWRRRRRRVVKKRREVDVGWRGHTSMPIPTAVRKMVRRHRRRPKNWPDDPYPDYSPNTSWSGRCRRRHLACWKLSLQPETPPAQLLFHTAVLPPPPYSLTSVDCDSYVPLTFSM